MLGIIDWGIGGVSIYKLIKKQIGVPVTYLSDTGVTPYGRMTRPELIARLDAVIGYLKKRGVTHLVIGCNAASTAIPFLKDQGIRIEGMIESAIVSTAKLKPTRLGVIGGRRTILSGQYRRGFSAHAISIEQRIAQPLSALIESGDVSSETLKRECQRILSPLKNCSHILLACTHYPAITSTMKLFVSSETIFVDPATDLVSGITKWKLPVSGTGVFMTTGDVNAMKKSSESAFGVSINDVQKITV